MDYSFPHYLLAKQTVDDRALNKEVLGALRDELASRRAPLAVIEAGAGIGTMLKRLLDWHILGWAEYTLLDQSGENIAYAHQWLTNSMTEAGREVTRLDPDRLRISGEGHDLEVHLVEADVLGPGAGDLGGADLLIAHALLDLLPMPGSLLRLLSLVKPGGLAWFTLNFDGLTTLEPAVDPALDDWIEELYHRSMDARPTGGDSRSGRHLFGHLQRAGAQVLAAGASDWVVFPRQGTYPADEAYFLHFILHFFEQSLSGHPQLDPPIFNAWLARRHEQIEAGELVYITHQMDFLVRV